MHELFSIPANELEFSRIKHRFTSAHHLIPCISPHIVQKVCWYSGLLIQCVTYTYSSVFIYITTHYANTY